MISKILTLLETLLINLINKYYKQKIGVRLILELLVYQKLLVGNIYQIIKYIRHH